MQQPQVKPFTVEDALAMQRELRGRTAEAALSLEEETDFGYMKLNFQENKRQNPDAPMWAYMEEDYE